MSQRPYKSKSIRLKIVEYTPETTTQTFTGTLVALPPPNYDNDTYTFTVPATDPLTINAILDMPAGQDFDLSMWDISSNRTGGWWIGDGIEREDIPNSDYSGWLRDPEWIHVEPPQSTGSWTIGVLAYGGSSGAYTITVSTTPSQHVLGVVDLANIQLIKSGNVEAKYGLSNRHKIGMKLARFTIQRWYKTDTGQTSLLYDLYENSTEFRLEEYLNTGGASPTFPFGFPIAWGAENRGLTLDNCLIYNYRLVTGAANDIVGERATGEAELWSKKTYQPTFPLRFPVAWNF